MMTGKFVEMVAWSPIMINPERVRETLSGWPAKVIYGTHGTRATAKVALLFNTPCGIA